MAKRKKIVKKEYTKLKLSEMIPYELNNKEHPEAQVKAIQKSIAEDDYIQEIIVDENNVIVAWHGRFEAMKAMWRNEEDIEVVKVHWRSDKQKERYRLRDNLTNTMWPYNMANIDVVLKRIDDPWLTALVVEVLKLETDAEDPRDLWDEDNVPTAPVKTTIKKGDIFQLWKHRVMCGDSTDEIQVAKLMDGNKCDMSFTSPPYNVWHNLWYEDKESKYIHKDDEEDYLRLIVTTTQLAIDYATDVFVNLQFLANNKRDMIERLHVFKDQFKDIFFWKKQTVQPAMAENVANSQVEIIALFWKENTKRTFWNKTFRGDFTNAIETSSAAKENKNSDIHNATYPTELPSKFIWHAYEKWSKVLDLFLWTWTTLIACEKLECACYWMELEPQYLEVCIKRFAEFVWSSDDIQCVNRKVNIKDILK